MNSKIFYLSDAFGVLRGILYLMLSCLPFCADAVASDSSSTIEVNVEAGFKPKSAVGLLLSTSGNLEKLNVSIREVGDNKYIVTIPLSRDEILGDTMATAILYSDAGEAVFGETKPAYIPSIRNSFLSLPTCTAPPSSNQSLGAVFANKGLFESLLEVRVGRREVALLTIQGLLKGKFLEKLRKLESAFGLSRVTPLSQSLPPYELNDRLSRILAAIKGMGDGP